MKKSIHGRLAALLRSSALLASGIAVATAAPTYAIEPLCSSSGFYFDTIITISLYDTDDEQILKDCDALMAHYESILSRTREGSDIWNINHSEGKPVTVSEETLELITDALAYCELSDGAFDITIAPVVDLWDFHQEDNPSVPDAKAVAEAITHVDYHCISIEGNQVQLTDPEAGIDLGAIAKGYISDGLKTLLLSKGCQSGMINLGGNVLTIGEKPDGSAWNIGIRRPFGDSAYDLISVVSVKDISVITSGTYERYFEQDGVIYHHILNPETGYSIDNGLTSVSILSEHGTDGDALSTTCFVLGPERGMELIESLEGVEALFISGEENTLTYSSGWPVKQ